MNRSKVPVLAVLCAASLALAACGDDESESPSAAATTETTASAPAASGDTGDATAFLDPTVAKDAEEVNGVAPLGRVATAADLEPRVAKYKAVPEKLLVTEPVSKKAEPGKNIAYLVCGVPVCTEYADAAEEAGKLLGWKLTRIPLGVSPQEFTQAYSRAAELKPDLVIGSGVPREVIDKGLKQLAAAKIPTIQFAASMPEVPEDKLFTADTAPTYSAVAQQVSEAVALDGDLKSKMVIFNVPQYPENTAMAGIIKDYLPKICPDCSVEVEQAAVTDIGKLAQKATAYVQRNPDTKYLMCAFGDLCQGVGQALKSAGQDVKILSRDSSSTNFANVASGTEWAVSPLPTGEVGWQLIDLAQRIFNEDPTEGTSSLPVQLVTEIKDPKSPTIGAVPDYKEQYKALWQLG